MYFPITIITIIITTIITTLLYHRIYIFRI